MEQNVAPTKGNLIAAKNTMRLSKLGYELMDKKRNVLIREIMELNVQAQEIQSEINTVFNEAYASLQYANIDMGISSVERFSYGVPHEDSINIKTRSIMGVEIPLVSYDNTKYNKPTFGFGNTTPALDEAFAQFNKVKELIIRLSMIENAAYRLAMSIKKTQKRANALKNITIPRYEALVKQIQETLEERERDEFTRLKVTKSLKEKNA
jgi:V/A-type H+-transporting ATPase subunit D